MSSSVQSGLHSFFISDDMRRMLQARQEAIYGGTASTAGLPHELLVYHSLYPLGISQDPVSKVYGLPTHVYRALNSVDGKTYCLRRIEGTLRASECVQRATHFCLQVSN